MYIRILHCVLSLCIVRVFSWWMVLTRVQSHHFFSTSSFIFQGGIQQLRGSNFTQFWPRPTSSGQKWTFTLCHVTPRGHSTDPHPSLLVHVVIEWRGFFSSEFIAIQKLCLNLKCWVGEGKIVGSVRTYERHMNELLFKLFFKCHGQKSKPWKILVNLAVLVWPHFSRTVWHILQ